MVDDLLRLAVLCNGARTLWKLVCDEEFMKMLKDGTIPKDYGTLRVLRAACDAGVRRVVVTSSFAAVEYGGEPKAAAYAESDWTDTSLRILPTSVPRPLRSMRHGSLFVPKVLALRCRLSIQ